MQNEYKHCNNKHIELDGLIIENMCIYKLKCFPVQTSSIQFNLNCIFITKSLNFPLYKIFVCNKWNI